MKYDLVCMLHRIECVHTNTHAWTTIANKKPTEMKSWAKCHDTSLSTELAQRRQRKKKMNERMWRTSNREDNDYNLWLLHLFSDSRQCFFFNMSIPLFSSLLRALSSSFTHSTTKCGRCFFYSRLICSVSPSSSRTLAAINENLQRFWFERKPHLRLLYSDKESKYAFECGSACVRNHLNYLIIMYCIACV